MHGRAFIPFALAALVLVAAASEGQAKGGAPITACGQVVTTSAFLTRSLDCAGSPGVVVGASGITIDLKGFTLRGDGSFHFGIDDDGGFDRVTIKSGVLRNFQRGLDAANGADRLALSSVVVSGNNGLGLYLSGDSASVKSSTFSGNAGFGVYVAGASATIVSSTASGNGSEGIRVFGDGAAVSANRAEANEFSEDCLGRRRARHRRGERFVHRTSGRHERRTRDDDPAECDPFYLC